MISLYKKYEKFILEHLNLILLLLLCASFLFMIINHQNIIGGGSQWDFRSHYFAARAYEAGLDPYRVENANQFNTTPYSIPHGINYPYHPFTLHWFRLFTGAAFPQATVIYVLLQIILIFFLIYIWKRYFLPGWVNILIFPLIVLFAFNHATFLALTSGNPAIFEAALIWVALVFLLRNRPLIFLVLISIISFFKGTPVLLAPLVFFLPEKKRNAMLFFLVLGMSAVIWLAPLAFAPGLFSSFWDYASNVREAGIINPCSYAFISDVMKKAGMNIGWLINGIYLSWITLVAAVYFLVTRKLNWNENKISIIFFSLLSYAIIVPRFKDYAYVQLLPVAYSLAATNPAMLVFYLFKDLSQVFKLPYLIAHYHPLFAAVISWGFLAWRISPKPARKVWQRAGVLSLTVLIVLAAPLILAEAKRAHDYAKNSLLKISISGLEAARTKCGAHEIIMNMNYEGYPLRVNRKRFERGIYAHAPSELVFRTNGKYRLFGAAIGISDTSRGKGSVRFLVKGDGKVLYSSPKIYSDQEPRKIKVDIQGIRELKLTVEDLGDKSYDHSVWLGPALIPAGIK